MTKTLYARFDGEALHPEEKLSLAPETRVLVTVEADEEEEPTKPEVREAPSVFDEQGEIKRGEPYSFLRLAASLNLEGLPSDYSERLDEYLYGSERPQDE